MWKELLLLSVSNAVLLGVLGFIARSLIVHWLEKDIERYRASLRVHNEREMERLRTHLRVRSFEHEVRFRWLHEKQVEILAETYAKLHTFYRNASSYVAVLEWAGEPSKEEKLKLVKEAADAFRDYFLPRRLYIPDGTFGRIKAFSDKLYDIVSEFRQGQEREKHGVERNGGYWSKAWEAVTKEAGPLFDTVRADFQKLMGVVSSLETVDEACQDAGGGNV
jgi:hypothetical protein